MELMETPNGNYAAKVPVPPIQPFFSDRVLELADEVMTWLLNEFDDGEWRPQMREFTPAERAAFFVALADAFSDSPDI
jgi:hypothetical protein